jgi:hypothetical protein
MRMQPNDLPILCLPLELSDEAADSLIEFLYALTEALEHHYCGQLLRYAHRNDRDPGPSPFDEDPGRAPSADPGDPPF